jgi:hypothetical protein
MAVQGVREIRVSFPVAEVLAAIAGGSAATGQVGFAGASFQGLPAWVWVGRGADRGVRAACGAAGGGCGCSV